MKQFQRQEAGNLPLDALREELNADFNSGLSAEEVEQRLTQFGPNELGEKEARSPLSILVEQFNELIIWLLIGAGIASILIGDVPVGVAVFAVVVVNTLIGFFSEWRATQTMQALRELGTVETAVRRDGRIVTVPADELVLGDVVVLEGGDVVPADLRLIEANRLQVDEAALTGESEAVSKQNEQLPEDTVLAEQKNMVFKGTAITRGSGEGVIVATGMNTEIGSISEMVEGAEDETTPLETQLDVLGQRLVWLTLSIAVIVTLSGVVVGRELILMIETGIALAIASVPEGLPITATVALARGMYRMAERNALVTKLATVETLGSTNIICTDKTGTLTEGRMAVQQYQFAGDLVRLDGDIFSPEGTFSKNGDPIDPEEEGVLTDALKIGVLCNNAAITHQEDGDEVDVVGEPLEVALLGAGLKAGYTRDDLLEAYPEEQEIAFDPDVKMMATIHEDPAGDSRYLVAVKGAPEAVLQACSRVQREGEHRDLSEDDRTWWNERNEEIAKEGLRVLGLAYKTVDSLDADPYDGLTLLGMAALLDPPREEVKDTVKACQDAGIRLVMLTGDQALTARKVADILGIAAQDGASVLHGSDIPTEHDGANRDRIIQANIVSRVSPKQKLELIRLHQDNGNIVAMTGDGVNDAPALKRADIGVAMGSGTEVAKEAADMVLHDDNLGTIILAIEQGRTIFNNIRRFIIYLLSSNVSTILTVGVASVLNAPLPVSPVQVLFLNVVVDVFPALALSVGQSSDDVMERPPREPGSSILERSHWGRIGLYGALIASTVLVSFFLAQRALGLEGDAMVTISFLTLMLAKLWHVFNMRDASESPVVNSVTSNPYVWGAFGLSVGLILAAVYFAPLATLLRTVPPAAQGWLLAVGMSLIPFVIVQTLKAINVIE